MSFTNVRSLGVASVERLGKTEKASQVTTSDNTGFEADFNKLFGARSAGQETNEEEVYAALVFHDLKTKVSAEVAERFRSVFKVQQKILGGQMRYASPELATKKALRYLTESGDLDRTTRHSVVTNCFSAAQLDNNHQALYDSIGGPNDPTKATKKFSAVIALMQKRLSTQA